MVKRDIKERFQILAANQYESQFGIEDTLNSFDNIHDVVQFLNRVNYDFYQVLDLEERVICEFVKKDKQEFIDKI